MTVSACSADIASDLDERQSREVMAALGRAGIAADRRAAAETYTIQVPTKQAARAMAILEAEGLPRPPEQGLAGLYGSASMIPTATEEKARYVAALSSEVAGHLEALDGVLDASVIITAPEDDPLARPDVVRPTPTASVLLRTRPEGAGIQDEAIRRLVAGAVEGLAADQVTVVARAAPPPPGTDTPTFAKVGPISVAASSKATLQGLLGFALLVVIGLGGYTFIGERKRADLRRQLAAHQS